MMEIWVDRATGVNYLYRKDGYSGGLTPVAGFRRKARCHATELTAAL